MLTYVFNGYCIAYCIAYCIDYSFRLESPIELPIVSPIELPIELPIAYCLLNSYCRIQFFCLGHIIRDSAPDPHSRIQGPRPRPGLGSFGLGRKAQAGTNRGQ